MKNLSHIIQGYLGMTPKDKGCESWTEMQSKMEEDINHHFEKEILEIVRQCLYYGDPEYYEQGGINRVINFPPNGTYKKAKEYYKRFYLNKNK